MKKNKNKKKENKKKKKKNNNKKNGTKNKKNKKNKNNVVVLSLGLPCLDIKRWIMAIPKLTIASNYYLNCVATMLLMMKGCLSYEDPNVQISALCWGLASAYRVAVDHAQKAKAETGTQTMPLEISDVPIESTKIGVQTPLETNAVFKTKGQLEASTASAKPTDIGVPIMDFMNTRTHMTTSTAKAMTETGVHTTNSEITIAPVTKKKTWIREDAGPTSLVPRLRCVTEEEEGAKGPRISLCREFFPSEYRLKEEGMTATEEEVVVREGARPKELGVSPKEKRTHPQEEGVAAQMVDKTQKPPKRMLTPDYTLLDCSAEEMEDYLRSSSRGLEDYSLPPPGENMKKWDWEPTSKLEVRVRELKRKEVNKKIVYVVDADFLEKKLLSPRHKKAEVFFHDDKKASGVAKRKSNEKEVFEKGEKIIQILLKAGFTIKKSKVKGPAKEIQFLGVKWQDGRQDSNRHHQYNCSNGSTDKQKETQAFLGAIGFWRMPIPQCSQIVSPLCLVTRKKNNFQWGPEQQQAFRQIKQETAHAMAVGPVRTGPDVKNVLYSAAGDNGPSWSLWQKVPGETQG
ncbi:hypothetical protein BTVI_60726 [Pitangus sulphuratus]|nr:hypothetical protein BTVI_60726 [Pitangus sulphuratus]